MQLHMNCEVNISKQLKSRDVMWVGETVKPPGTGEGWVSNFGGCPWILRCLLANCRVPSSKKILFTFLVKTCGKDESITFIRKQEANQAGRWGAGSYVSSLASVALADVWVCRLCAAGTEVRLWRHVLTVWNQRSNSTLWLYLPCIPLNVKWLQRDGWWGVMTSNTKRVQQAI